MKYNQPHGNPDPNAAYVDRNTPGALAGSRVPAFAIEAPQREIMSVISAAGIEGSNADMTQLLQAINLLIAAATGGAGDPNYVLMTQARARLPIYPEIQTTEGTIPVISPSAGQVRVPAGYEFLHRGIFSTTTIQSDFVTLANKTYHLRWSPSSGFQLKDLADAAYNPSALAETHVAFDTNYDDMLVARVTTSAGNIPTVRNLVNRHRLVSENAVYLATNEYIYVDNAPPSAMASGIKTTLNWSRQPMAALTGFTDFDSSSNLSSEVEMNFGVRALSRYELLTYYQITGNPNRGGWIGHTAHA